MLVEPSRFEKSMTCHVYRVNQHKPFCCQNDGNNTDQEKFVCFRFIVRSEDYQYKNKCNTEDQNRIFDNFPSTVVVLQWGFYGLNQINTETDGEL